jgi:hypothetical protein
VFVFTLDIPFDNRYLTFSRFCSGPGQINEPEFNLYFITDKENCVQAPGQPIQPALSPDLLVFAIAGEYKVEKIQQHNLEEENVNYATRGREHLGKSWRPGEHKTYMVLQDVG